MPFSSYANIPPNVVSALNLVSTPQTLVVSPNGKLLKHWRGAFAGKIQAEIEQYFGVKLPGLGS